MTFFSTLQMWRNFLVASLDTSNVTHFTCRFPFGWLCFKYIASFIQKGRWERGYIYKLNIFRYIIVNTPYALTHDISLDAWTSARAQSPGALFLEYVGFQNDRYIDSDT